MDTDVINILKKFIVIGFQLEEQFLKEQAIGLTPYDDAHCVKWQAKIQIIRTATNLACRELAKLPVDRSQNP